MQFSVRRSGQIFGKQLTHTPFVQAYSYQLALRQIDLLYGRPETGKTCRTLKNMYSFSWWIHDVFALLTCSLYVSLIIMMMFDEHHDLSLLLSITNNHDDPIFGVSIVIHDCTGRACNWWRFMQPISPCLTALMMHLPWSFHASDVNDLWQAFDQFSTRYINAKLELSDQPRSSDAEDPQSHYFSLPWSSPALNANLQPALT